MRLALCGNPNVGKTTIFNRLTRSDAPVGNWHGVTVGAREKKIAGTADTVLCDLPGAYSLTPRSKEEEVTRDGILFGGFDVIVYVAEVNNLRRNLYFLTQILEARKKAVLVVNMLDEARGKLDLGLISKRLGIPVVGTSERYENPRSAILEAAARAKPAAAPYAAERDIAELSRTLEKHAAAAGLSPELAALKIKERDGYFAEKLGVKLATCGDSCAACDADRPAILRYAYIDSVLRGAAERGKAYWRTDRIDRIVLGRLALPIFFLIMTAVFAITFEAGKPLSALLDRLIGLVKRPIEVSGMPDWVRAFLCDGVIEGVGAVLAFLPQVTLLFILTALLQDSGYMSRVAFVTDGFFKKFGLSGRTAFSLLLGLGCSATAVISARGIADGKARRRTAFVTPFVPCSARLSVFVAFTAYLGLPVIAVAALYALGFLAALAVLKIMRLTGGESGGDELLMEMPPYRLPSLKRVFKGVFRNIISFVARVGSVVLGVSAIMWILSNYSVTDGFCGGESLMNTFAGIIAPVFTPLGFGDWRAVAALISGVAAKETLISVITSLGGMDAVFPSAVSAASFLIFTCLYVPCAATLAAIGRENGAKSAALSVLVHTIAAYAASLVFYNSARLYMYDVMLFASVYGGAAAAVAVLLAVRAVRAKRRALVKSS